MSILNSISSYFSPSTPPATERPQDKPQTTGDTDVRGHYNTDITSKYENEFKTKFKSFHDNEQCFGDDLAREAYEARNAIKEKHQEQTSTIGRFVIAMRNLIKYGSLNADYDGLAKTGKNPEEIAYSAFKTGGGDLGLANNGFGETLEVWNAIKDSVIIYPEEITPAMIEAYKAQPKGKVDVAAILAARETETANPALNPLGGTGKRNFI